MFSTIKLDNTVTDARKYRIARVVACMRGQLWLTFETIDDATRRSSTAAQANVGGRKPSGEDGGDDVLYVRTTTTSSLTITAPLIKRDSSVSPPPGSDILILAPVTIDYQPGKAWRMGMSLTKTSKPQSSSKNPCGDHRLMSQTLSLKVAMLLMRVRLYWSMWWTIINFPWENLTSS